MTNPTQSGKQELEDVFSNRWEEIEQSINDYLEKIKGKGKAPESVVEQILKLSYEELKGLTAEDCGEYSFLLSQYGYFLQQELNYHNSKLTWCESTLSYLTANFGNPAVRSNTFIKQQEKAAILCGTFKNVKTILDMQVQAKIICDNLNSLAWHIESMVKTLVGLQQSKRVR